MKFKDATGSSIENGMKVLLFVQVNYNVQHGLSLNIRDIDPKFTLGDREARRLKIINDLRIKKILNNNKSLPLPIEFTNVAVISSENAAGLGDFFAEAKLF
jgi:exodeoxyribonuclease VII large subunit